MTINDKIDLIFNKYLTKHRIDSVQIVNFEVGQVIIKEGEPMQNLYFTLEGKTKVFKEYENGKTFLLGFFDEINILGDIEYFHNIPASCTVKVVEPIKAIKISFSAINMFYKDDVSFVTNMLLQLSKKVLHNNLITANNMVYPLHVRLASYLLSICPDNSQYTLPNLEDLSNNLGSSYRHLFRKLREFENDNLIQRNRREVCILDRNKLTEIARGNIYESPLKDESSFA
ncbi:MAG: Crp/Fnr family transcriptional regulator [Candidatus Izemoplasma sp.]|nr:Crp/Fnr family transcriptional regulator [Candidatus Izemoplasma sp.]